MTTEAAKRTGQPMSGGHQTPLFSRAGAPDTLESVGQSHRSGTRQSVRCCPVLPTKSLENSETSIRHGVRSSKHRTIPTLGESGGLVLACQRRNPITRMLYRDSCVAYGRRRCAERPESTRPLPTTRHTVRRVPRCSRKRAPASRAGQPSQPTQCSRTIPRSFRALANDSGAKDVSADATEATGLAAPLAARGLARASAPCASRPGERRMLPRTCVHRTCTPPQNTPGDGHTTGCRFSRKGSPKIQNVSDSYTAVTASYGGRS